MPRPQADLASNQNIAEVLREIADLLERAGDSPFRVRAYRRAAKMSASCSQSLASVWLAEGEAGLRQFRGIGKSLAKIVSRLLRSGHCDKLDNLRKRRQGTLLLRTLPGVGPRLAAKIEQDLGVVSLEELRSAVRDGRLRQLPGIGRKRLRAVRESLASRLPASEKIARVANAWEPPIGTLLAIDAEYREKALANKLPLATPQRFNPASQAWLPVLHTQQGAHKFTAHFVNSARSHETGHFRDWVAITCDSKRDFGHWTILTASQGELRGKRVVVDRQDDCREHYRQKRVQLQLELA